LLFTWIFLNSSLLDSLSINSLSSSIPLSASLPPRKAADVQSVALEKEKEEASNRESIVGEKKKLKNRGLAENSNTPKRKDQIPKLLEETSNTKIIGDNYRRTGRPELGGCL